MLIDEYDMVFLRKYHLPYDIMGWIATSFWNIYEQILCKVMNMSYIYACGQINNIFRMPKDCQVRNCNPNKIDMFFK